MRWPILFLCAAAACTPDFQSQSQVIDLRVLAVQAEPPEAQFDADGGAVDPVKLTVLAVDPVRPSSLATLSASLCEPTDAGLCNEALSLPQPTLTRDGGTLFTTTLEVPQPVLAQAAGASDLGAFDGIRVQYSFSVADGDPAGPQTGEKVVIYSPRGGHAPNKNPILRGVSAIEPDGGSTFLADGQLLAAQPGVDIGLTPLLPPDQIERYTTTDLRGNLIDLIEFPAYSFFTTPGGQFDRETASEPVDGGVAPPQGLTRFQAPDGGSGTLWVVVRDGRGGESWLTIPWTSP
jgi:hypothetical protein